MYLKLLAINPALAASSAWCCIGMVSWLLGYAATDVGILLGTYSTGTTTPNPSTAGMTLGFTPLRSAQPA